jgi:hypothetical protein
MMTTAKQSLLNQTLQNKTLVKAIAGISNVDLTSVGMVVTAANQAGVKAVDVAATPEVVAHARALTDAILFASSVDPQALLTAVEAGADVAELGNFDGLYAQGQFFGAEAVLALAQETMVLIGEKAPVCVTIPGHLSVTVQLELLAKLKAMGCFMVQTEGAIRLLGSTPEVKLLATTEKALLAIENAKVLAKANILPVMAASGLNASNVGLAISAGAVAVGIGSAINQLSTVEAMVAELSAIQKAVTATAAQAVLAVAV